MVAVPLPPRIMLLIIILTSSSATRDYDRYHYTNVPSSMDPVNLTDHHPFACFLRQYYHHFYHIIGLSKRLAEVFGSRTVIRIARNMGDVDYV